MNKIVEYRYEKKEAEGAKTAYEAILGLINSGTPVDGLKFMLESNIKGLDKLIDDLENKIYWG
jgi:hypothetical protein